MNLKKIKEGKRRMLSRRDAAPQNSYPGCQRVFCFCFVLWPQFTIAASPLAVAAKQNKKTLWHPGYKTHDLRAKRSIFQLGSVA